MSFPAYTTPTASGPGLLYVNSKVTDSKLTPEIFTEWYEDVHIADIFKSKTIMRAFRYYSVTPESVDRPYLALYPLEEVKVLQSDAFKSIPVHSNLVPGDGLIFNLANFDTRYHTHVKTLGNKSNDATYVVTVSFDKDSVESASKKAEAIYKQQNAVRTSLYENYFSRQNRIPEGQKTLKDPPKYLVVIELDSEASDLAGLRKDGEIVAQYSLLKAFGDKVKVFE